MRIKISRLWYAPVMRPSLLLLVAIASLSGCASPPAEPGAESSSTGSESTGTTSPTSGATQLMTTDNTMESTVTPTSGATTTTTGDTDPAEESSDASTGGGPVTVEGLARPESILHDKVDDVYLIANVNGEPDGDDDDGFISRVLPDGEIEALRWIDGADADVELSAPKGMAISGDVLYVADLRSVRKFDRITGAPLGSIAVDGAVFINDLTVSPFGKVYASDTGANALYEIDSDDTYVTMLSTSDLAGPNGVLYTGDYLLVAAFNGDELFTVAYEGPQAMSGYKFEFGQLDGVVKAGDDLLVSTWEEGKAGVYRLSMDFTTVTPVVSSPTPADIEVDADRNMLLIPVMFSDRAEFHPL